MPDPLTSEVSRAVVDFSHRLYQRRMVAARGGNVSARLPDGRIVITPHGAALGYVREDQLIEMSLEGHCLAGAGRPSAEAQLHLALYRALPVFGIVHAHPVCATALTLTGESLKPLTFETLLALGEVRVVAQDTPTVVDTSEVVDAMRTNNAILLQKHGSVTVGETLEEAYFLTELLEEAAEIVIASCRAAPEHSAKPSAGSEGARETKDAPPAPRNGAFPLFSDEHIVAIAKLVNEDAEAQKRGAATQLNTRLGIRLDETGQLHNIHLQDGRVTLVDHDPDVDFLISGPEAVWRQVFKGQIDPFVATTQRRLKLRGDMGKLSRWYTPFHRVFELWKRAPVQ